MLRKIQVHTHLNSGIKIKTFNFVCPVQCHSLHFTHYTRYTWAMFCWSTTIAWPAMLLLDRQVPLMVFLFVFQGGTNTWTDMRCIIMIEHNGADLDWEHKPVINKTD